MRVVGNELADIAVTSGDAARKNLFGRSAVNRYYYSAFLGVRALVVRVDPRWSKPNHSDLPTLLLGEFLKVLDSHLASLEKLGEISKADRAKARSRVRGVLGELANLLSKAREARRIADYEPETLMEVREGALRLKETTLESARAWERRIEMLVGVVHKEYVQFDVIKN